MKSWASLSGALPSLLSSVALAQQVPSTSEGSAQPTATNTTTNPSTIEVIVQEARKPRDGSALTQRESREIPGAFGDPFRTVESMPGVSGMVAGLPYFFIRGAPPGNVGYFLDGIRLPMLYHAFAGPSVLHPAFIESIELYRGGYPASFGRYAGAVVAGRTTAPATQPRAEANVRLFDAGAMVATPFADGRGSVMLGGRYSYTGFIVSKLSDVQLNYWDYQTLVSYALSPKDTVRILAFGASDYSASNQRSVVSGIEFHRLDLRTKHRFSDDTSLQLAVTAGWDRSRQEDNQYGYVTRTTAGYTLSKGSGLFVRDSLVQSRASLSQRLSPNLNFNVGVDAAVDQFRLDTPNRLSTDFGQLLSTWYPTRNDLVAGAFVEATWTPVAHFELLPGLRWDEFYSQGHSAVGIEPRLAIAADVTSRVRILHAFGLAHQPPATAPPGLPGVQQVAGLTGGLQRSYQASSGIEVRLGWDLLGSITAFDNVFTNLSDPAGNSGTFGVESSNVRSTSSALGLEFSLRRPITRRLGGFVNYTLSRTTRSYGTITSSSAFERRHVGNLVLAYDLGAHWRIGARCFYESGVPVRIPTTEGPRYDGSRRAPGFFRVDLRLEKRWRLGERGQISAVAEMLNATMSREVLRRNCNEAGCRDDSFGPFFLPSIGIEARY